MCIYLSTLFGNNYIYLIMYFTMFTTLRLYPKLNTT
jgi:hypothetical protein